MTQVFLLTVGSGITIQSWPDPGNWNPINKIECVGAGSPGISGNVNGAGGGGGGGAYAIATNIVPTFPVNYYVPSGNMTPAGDFATTFNRNSASPPGRNGGPAAVAGQVIAQNGEQGQPSAGP